MLNFRKQEERQIDIYHPKAHNLHFSVGSLVGLGKCLKYYELIIKLNFFANFLV